MKQAKTHPKPFLKWVGGKRQLLGDFKDLYPKELQNKKIDNYFEPFVGAGAVFFDIIANYDIKNAYLYDINEDLILTYKVVQKNVQKLISSLGKHSEIYKNLPKDKQKIYYYELRDKFNLERFNINYKMYSNAWIERAAQIIFLNKTCFNGLFRLNSSGEFNVPKGSYKNPLILDEKGLLSASKALQKATIKCVDFKKIRNDISLSSAFVYFDPPYRPISSTANFTNYSKFGFGDKEQLDLAKLFNKLNKMGHFLMLSNSDPKSIDKNDNFFDELYANFNIKRIVAKRIVNCDSTKRKSIKEIIVRNYT